MRRPKTMRNFWFRFGLGATARVRRSYKEFIRHRRERVRGCDFDCDVGISVLGRQGKGEACGTPSSLQAINAALGNNGGR